jgi:VWFA-related protein
MSTLRSAAFLITSLALTGLPGSSLVGQAGEVFRESLEVRLVEIGVVVTDGDGRPVTGLTREDFELRQDGRALKFTHFVAVEGGSRTEDGSWADAGDAGAEALTSGASPPQPFDVSDQLHLVLYIDRAHLQPGELGDVIAAVEALLQHGLGPTDRVMLVEANQSLEFIHGFTSDQDLILAELDGLKAQAPRARATAEFPHLLRQIERAAQQGPDILARARDDQPMNLRAQIESYASETFKELQITTHQLRWLIPTMAGLAGRKEILFVGGTLPTDAPQQLHNAWRSAFGPGSAYQQARGQDDDFSRAANVSSVLNIDVADFHDLFRAVAEDANRNGVTLHVLDAGSLRRSIGTSLGRGETVSEQGGGITHGRRPDSSRRIGNPSTLESMAEATGGRAMVRSRDFAAALEDVANDLRNYYVLAFPLPEDDDKTHEIRVKLKGKHKKLTVRHRQAYLSRSSDRATAEKVVSALVLGEAVNAIGIELAAGPPRSLEDREDIVSLPLRVVFPIAGVTLVEQADAHRGQVSLFLSFGDIESGASEVRKIVVQLGFNAEQLAEAEGRNIEYAIDPLVPAGTPRFAVALRDDLGSTTSTTVLVLAPDPGSRPAPVMSRQD